MSANYNSIAIELGEAELSLTMPEIAVLWHPFSGFFFIGAGVGQQTLSATGADIDVDAPGLSEGDEAFDDVVDAAEAFAETSYVNFTFLRLGYLF